MANRDTDRKVKKEEDEMELQLSLSVAGASSSVPSQDQPTTVKNEDKTLVELKPVESKPANFGSSLDSNVKDEPQQDEEIEELITPQVKKDALRNMQEQYRKRKYAQSIDPAQNSTGCRRSDSITRSTTRSVNHQYFAALIANRPQCPSLLPRNTNNLEHLQRLHMMRTIRSMRSSNAISSTVSSGEQNSSIIPPISSTGNSSKGETNKNLIIPMEGPKPPLIPRPNDGQTGPPIPRVEADHPPKVEVGSPSIPGGVTNGGQTGPPIPVVEADHPPKVEVGSPPIPEGVPNDGQTGPPIPGVEADHPPKVEVGSPSIPEGVPNDGQTGLPIPGVEADHPPKVEVGSPSIPEGAPGPPSLKRESYMPIVATTGDGPSGKTIHGVLCKSSEGALCKSSEVDIVAEADIVIVCLCHGHRLTAAEFVQHAGGTDLTNPMKRITMIEDSAVLNDKASNDKASTSA